MPGTGDRRPCPGWGVRNARMIIRAGLAAGRKDRDPRLAGSRLRGQPRSVEGPAQETATVRVGQRRAGEIRVRLGARRRGVQGVRHPPMRGRAAAFVREALTRRPLLALRLLNLARDGIRPLPRALITACCDTDVGRHAGQQRNHRERQRFDKDRASLPSLQRSRPSVASIVFSHDEKGQAPPIARLPEDEHVAHLGGARARWRTLLRKRSHTCRAPGS